MNDNSQTEGQSTTETPTDFIRQIIEIDLATGTHEGKVHTRFPPEPNGFA